MSEQDKRTPLFKCFMCNHEFPREYISFNPSDIDYCRDGEACKQRVARRVSGLVSAKMGSTDYWSGIKEQLEFLGLTNIDVNKWAE